MNIEEKMIEAAFDNEEYNIRISQNNNIIEIEIESDNDIKIELENMVKISQIFNSKNVYISSFSTYDNYDGSGYPLNTDYSITISVEK